MNRKMITGLTINLQKVLAYIAISIGGIFIFSIQLLAIEDDWVIISRQFPVYKKTFVPLSLTYDQVQNLKSEKIVSVGQSCLRSDNPKLLLDKMPGKYGIISNIISNMFHQNKVAKLVDSYVGAEEHPSLFHAVYEFDKWFNFSVIGCDESLVNAIHVRDIDSEVMDEQDSTNSIFKYNYNSPSGSHLNLNSEDINIIRTTRIMTILSSIRNPSQEEGDIISLSLITKIQKAFEFAGPYVLNDALQTFAPRVVSKELLTALNMFSASHGYNTPIHAAFKQKRTEDEDSLSSKREKLTRCSEMIGTLLEFIPAATKARTFLNLSCQYAGYDSLSHLTGGVPSKSTGLIEEQSVVQRRLSFTKGMVRLTITLCVPGGKFIVVAGKIYEFTNGESFTETLWNTTRGFATST